MQTIFSELPTFSDFEGASRAVLAFLHERLGFNLWMMTRMDGANWIVLQAEDHGYSIEEGEVFVWADPFCSQVIPGLGPRIIPRTKHIHTYAETPRGQQLPIGAYIAVPVTRSDGSVFGTLCGIDPRPKRKSIRDYLPLIELLARLLGTILAADLEAIEQERRLERSRQQALTDELTGVLNRRGWEQCIAAEESRAQRYGNPSCIFMIDLDDLKQINDAQGHDKGDMLIRNAAQSLATVVRKSDVLARIGGDEFAILGIECDSVGAEAMAHKITTTLSSNGINASIGKALRDPTMGLISAIADADRAMYAAKVERKKTIAGRCC